MAAVLIVLAFGTPSNAQQWVGNASGTWATASNWSGGVVPTGSTSTALTLEAVASSGFTATNDLGAFTLRALSLGNLTDDPLIVTNASGSSLTFDGITPNLFVGGPGPTTLSGGSVTVVADVSVRDSNLNAGPTIFTLTSALAGAGGITINRSVHGFLGETVLNPTANTLGRQTILAAGGLRLGSATALGTTRLTVTAPGTGLDAVADLRAATAMTVANGVTLGSGATLNVLTGPAITLSGNIVGSGSFQLGDGLTPGVTTFTMASPTSHTGATRVLGGTLNVTGTILASPLVVGRGGTAVVGSSTTFDANRLNPTATLLGGTLSLVGNATAGNDLSQSVTTLNVEGFGTVTVDAQATTSTRLAVTALNRVTRGTVRVRGDALGSLAFGTAGSATLTVGNAAVVGGGGATGSTTRSIVPYAVGATTLAGFGDHLVTEDVHGLRPLAAAEYATRLPLVPYAAPAATNYRLTQSAVPLTVPTTVNALTFATNAGVGVYGLAGAAAPMTVTSGVVLAAADARTGPLAFGTAEGIVTGSNGTLVLGPVTGSNGLTISGTGETVATNLTGLTGPITVNGGSLTSSISLPALPVTLNGGGVSFVGFGGTFSNPISVGPAGGFANARPAGTSTVGRSQTLVLSGPITGDGIFAISGGGGRVEPTATNTAFAGTWQVTNGSLVATTPANLGTGPVVLNGGTLELTGTAATTYANRFVLTATSTLFTSSTSTITLTGPVESRSPTAGLTMVGGTVILEGDAYFTGPTVLGVGGNAPARGAFLTLRGANGQLRGTSSLTVRENGVLEIDQTGPVNSNRLSRTPVTLAGGRLDMLAGPNGTPGSTQRLGGLTLAANTGGTINLTPSGFLGPAARFDFDGPLTRESGSTLLISVFRPDALNLGQLGVGGNGEGSVRFTTAPTLVNGILPSVFANVEVEDPGLQTFPRVVRLTTTEATGTQPAGFIVRELRRTDPGVVVGAFAGSSATSNVLFPLAGDTPSGTRTVNSLSLESHRVRISGPDTLTLTSGQLALHNTSAAIVRTLPTDSFGTLASPAGVDLSIGRARQVDGSGVPQSNQLAVALAPGSGTVNLAGAGHVTLFAPSPAVRRLNIHGGQVNLATAPGVAPFAPTTHLYLNAFTAFVADTQDVAIDTISGHGTIDVGTGTFTIGEANGSSVFAGGFSAQTGGTLVKAGTGTLRLTDVQGLPTLAIGVTGGTLAFGAAAATTPAAAAVTGGDVTLNLGTTLALDGVTSFERTIRVRGSATLGSSLTGSSTTFMAPINLQGSLVGDNPSLTVDAPALGGFRFTGGFAGVGDLVVASGNVQFDTANTHTGGTTVQSSGQTLIGANNAFNARPLTLAGTTFLLPTATNRTINSPTTLTGTVTFGPSLVGDSFSTGFGLTFNAGVALAGTGNRTVSVTGTGNFVFEDVTGSAANGLTKTGGGTLTLTGVSPFAGPLAVDQGTLHMVGTKTGTGAVTVGTATATAVPGVLSGVGSVAGAVTVRASGIVSPGASPGVLAVPNGITFETGSTYVWELAANTTAGPGTNFDRINPGSAATVVQAGAKLVPSFIGTATVPNASDAFWQTSRSWVVVEATSPVSGPAFAIDNTAWVAAGSFSATSGGNGVTLTWTPQPVPEPAGLFGLAAVTLGVVAYRRRGRNGGRSPSPEPAANVA